MSTEFLSRIQSPADLKELSKKDLPKLAAEIRQVIIQTVSKTGGHLAPSLGVVELAIALHYVFDAPRDKIIWDVGHQAYAHKLLTGRRDRFSTLRQHGGLSGFARMSESPYDAFTVGHSSTSVSAGLGMACAKAMKNDPAKVIAVIGDGSMTAGLAYEGLNQAGDLKKDLIVVLNDNEMSISPNVGALSSFLSRKLSAKPFWDWRKELKSMLGSTPSLYQLVKRLEEGLKAFITPGMLFEAFDFTYVGPIRGHRLDQLIRTLDNVRQVRAPVLLHVLTTKGKGYPPAEKNPTYFHGVGGFEVSTGDCKSPSGVSYTEIFGKTAVALAEKDERVVAVTAAMPEGTGLTAFSERFPDRFFDVGIAEQHGVTFAAGLAAEGFKPIVAIYSTFLQRAYDQIIHDVCLESLPVTFALDRAGLVGEDGPTHHGAFDLSFLRVAPNMVVMAPKDERELADMLATALSLDRPVAVRYPRGAGPGVLPEGEPDILLLGKAEILQKGKDVVLLALGRMVCEATAAAKVLKEEGISATVVNARFAKPLDSKLIRSLAREIPRMVVAEENALSGGFGSAVMECLNEAGIKDVCVSRIGLPDRFVEHGPPALLRKKYGLDAAGIVKKARELLEASGA
ncbi:MAG: 1-deoxy-D-xylulose-5-phosphate synthase [Deltaproteobacteria bacterium]|nr:1-deoxy-D-xylulose-5-phosphate synthase [Deltaproteobacteria bacterium]